MASVIPDFGPIVIESVPANYTALVDILEKHFANALLKTKGDSALGQIVGRHLYFHLVVYRQTNFIESHFSGKMGDDALAAFEF